MNDAAGPVAVGTHLQQHKDLQVDERKIVEYLLNEDHSVGSGKAKFFKSRGFLINDWEEFANALRDHARRNPIAMVKESEYGTKYVVDCTIISPDNADYCIRVVWNQQKDTGAPKLVTAHPLSKP